MLQVTNQRISSLDADHEWSHPRVKLSAGNRITAGHGSRDLASRQVLTPRDARHLKMPDTLRCQTSEDVKLGIDVGPRQWV